MNTIEGQSDKRIKYSQAFDTIAGAPDWEGGSGAYLSAYYFDDKRKEGIYLQNDTIVYNSYDEKGNKFSEVMGNRSVQ